MAAVDIWLDVPAHEALKIDGPYRNAAAVVTSDTTDLPFVTRALAVSAAGNYAVVMQDALTPTTAVTIPLGAGISKLRVSRVMVTNTLSTASIVALW